MPPDDTDRLAASEPKAGSSSGFARIGRNIARRTTDLLAIAILAIGGLMVGGRLSEWWSTRPEDIATPGELAQQEGGSAGDWGAFGAPVTLEFGSSSHSLRRQLIQGSPEKVTGLLMKWCRETVQSDDPPKQPPRPEELRLLEQLQKLKVVEEIPGRGRIFRVDHPLILVLGVAQRSKPSRQENEVVAESEDAAGLSRVICWGFAFPLERGNWTLFQSAIGRTEARRSPIPQIDLPPGSRRILSLRNDSGDGLIGFTGSGDPGEWRRVFEEWFESNGWSAARPWTEADQHWSARYASPARDVPEAGFHGTVDVQISQDGEASNALSGLLNFLPRK